MVDRNLESQAQSVKELLDNKGFTHLHVLVRERHLVIGSKDDDGFINRARLTAMSAGQYQLSMADHTERWEPTPYAGDLHEMIRLLTDDFSFALIDFADFT